MNTNLSVLDRPKNRYRDVEQSAIDMGVSARGAPYNVLLANCRESDEYYRATPDLIALT
jgi:hypothetical protein